jgi:hypothetical protein
MARSPLVILRTSFQRRRPAVAGYMDDERRRAGWRCPKSGLLYAAALIEAPTFSMISPI